MTQAHSPVHSPVHSPIHSMTGFAAVEGSLPDGTGFTLTLKSVNHRFLDLLFRLPSGSDALESAMRTRLKSTLDRGHITITLDLIHSPSSSHAINHQALDTLVADLRQAMARLGLPGEPDLGTLLRLPGVFTSELRSPRPDHAQLHPAVLQALDRASDGLRLMRANEGASLVQELRAAMARLRAATDAVSDLRSGVREALFDRLRTRLQALLADSAVSNDRLLTEAALLADRSDVEEETVRLRAHIDRFLAILDEGGAVGKRLDFLLQELNREANTVLSKTGAAAGPESLHLTELGLAMKVDIERTREQVQNLE